VSRNCDYSGEFWGRAGGCHNRRVVWYLAAKLRNMERKREGVTPHAWRYLAGGEGARAAGQTNRWTRWRLVRVVPDTPGSPDRARIRAALESGARPGGRSHSDHHPASEQGSLESLDDWSLGNNVYADKSGGSPRRLRWARQRKTSALPRTHAA
jgi:hypothetical protein